MDTPLDAGRFADDPCALVGDAERGTLALPVATKVTGTGGPACDLSADPGNAKPVEFLRLRVTSSLASFVAQCGKTASAQCAEWSTTVIDGYPAVRANGAMEAAHGSCKLLLGISDTTAVLLNDVRAAAASEPDCDRAEKTAAVVLSALRR